MKDKIVKLINDRIKNLESTKEKLLAEKSTDPSVRNQIYLIDCSITEDKAIVSMIQDLED